MVGWHCASESVLSTDHMFVHLPARWTVQFLRTLDVAPQSVIKELACYWENEAEIFPELDTWGPS